MNSTLSLKAIFVLALFSLFSCKEKNAIDSRPKDQQSFIRIVKAERAQVQRLPLTDPNRPVIIDDGVKRIKIYIADTLQSKFDGWDVRVLDNSKTDPNGTEVKITFGMSIDDFNLEETGRFKSIVFRQSLSDAQPPLNEKLKELNVGNHVKITGSFVTRDKRIDVDPYNEKEFKLSKNIFANPEFRVDITDVLVVED